MVYCGKPSKGCSNCRERKVRCDQREPGCGQCDKRQQTCPGYRNLVDLMFRDESSHVIKKAKAKARSRPSAAPPTPATPTSILLPPPDFALSPAPSTSGILTPRALTPGALTPGAHTPGAPYTLRAPTPAPLSILPSNGRSSALSPEPFTAASTSLRHLSAIMTPKSQPSPAWAIHDDCLLPSPDSEEYPRTPSIALPYSVTPSLQEQGTAFFFSKFVSAEENSTNHRFDYVFEVWKPASLLPERQVDGVMASMTAVGLAGLAQMTKSTAMLEYARKSYGAALRLTNQALRDQVEAPKDTTMLSVLILGIFEMVVGRQKPLRAWHEHLNGAAALAKMRGIEQFKTPSGIKMFIMLNYSLIISCITRAVPMPQALMELRQQMPMFQAGDDAGIAVMAGVAGGGSNISVDPTIENHANTSNGSTNTTASSIKIESPSSPNSSGPDSPIAGAPLMLNSEPLMPVYKLLQLRCDLITSHVTSPTATVAKLWEIESDFQTWFSLFPSTWHYHTVRSKTTNPAVMGGILCHSYTSTQHATVWSGMRSTRLLVLEMLRAELIEGFEAVSPRFLGQEFVEMFYKTDALLKRLNHSVVMSTPFNLGKVSPITNPDAYVSIPTVVAVHEPAGRGHGGSISSPRSTSSGGSSGSPRSPMDDPTMKPPRYRGATLLDPAALGPGSTLEESEDRFHMLASANNVMLIPLYYVGMSAVCTPEIKQYVMERLDAIWRENGVEQAQMAAAIVEEHDLGLHRKVRFPTVEMEKMSARVARQTKVFCDGLAM